MLSEEKSMWGSDLLISVTKEVPGSDNVTLSGKFISKVFEGSYKNMGKWANEMKVYVSSKNKEIKRLYFGYTTCPACAKKYGKNYVVLLAEVEGRIKEPKPEAGKKEETSESDSGSK
jgi:hypothetical protein